MCARVCLSVCVSVCVCVCVCELLPGALRTTLYHINQISSSNVLENALHNAVPGKKYLLHLLYLDKPFRMVCVCVGGGIFDIFDYK